MNRTIFQEKKWEEGFGSDYTNRNPKNIKEMDALYIKNYGISRTKLNLDFLGKFDRFSKILEAGTNVGIQLGFLQKMGFKNLYGIEINKKTVEISKLLTKNINIIQGSVVDIPFREDYFNIVFTSGLLIHISPLNIKKAMSEIYRCSKKYIWGFEYYSSKYMEIPYRGNKSMLWKGDFAKMFLDNFKDLKLIKEKKVKYLGSENIDSMFLLRKNGKK